LELLLFAEILENVENIVVVDLCMSKVENVFHSIVDHDEILQIGHGLGHVYRGLFGNLDTVVCLLKGGAGTNASKAWHVDC